MTTTTQAEPPPGAVSDWLDHLNRVGGGRYVVRYDPAAHDSPDASTTRATSVRWRATLRQGERFSGCERTLYRATPYALRDAIQAQEKRRPKEAVV